MTRRQTLFIYAFIWLAIYVYGVVAGLSSAFAAEASTPLLGLERFLTLQVAACIAAAAVLVAGRQFRPDSAVRTAAYAPTVVTVGGTFLVAFLLGHPAEMAETTPEPPAPIAAPPAAAEPVPQVALLNAVLPVGTE